jgi:23S rRNA-/tRNA-specific pseudouridylate synthase
MVPPLVDILYEDNACLVVNKPGGLLTQAPLGIDSLEFQIKRLLKERDQKPGGVYLGVPHRLDRPVSGAIVFAKNVRAARRISQQFEHRLVRKTYWALVEGHVAADAGTWTDHLKKIEGEPRSVVVDHTDPAGRVAILHYRVVERIAAPRAGEAGSAALIASDEPRGPRSAERTLLEIELETGRTHQIRVQCASRRHPLVGDTLYGSGQSFGAWSADERERLIGLHARSLALRHPMSGEALTFVAPLPAVWREEGAGRESLCGDRVSKQG